MPRVSRDGATVAFIAGIMSDFGSTGGDVYSLPLDGGTAVNLTPAMQASARALAWNCDGRLLVQWLAGDKTQLVDLGKGRQPAAAKVLWSGEESLSNGDRYAAMAACPSGVIAVSQLNPSRRRSGDRSRTVGHWRALGLRINAGLRMAARVAGHLVEERRLHDVQGWLLLPEHADGKMPLVTVVHGGPASAAVPRFSGPGLTSALLERGSYAVFRPNPRGSYGQGERFTQANVRDFGQRRPARHSGRHRRRGESRAHRYGTAPASPAAATVAS